jgi:multidrug resistance efflux pump
MIAVGAAAAAATGCSVGGDGDGRLSREEYLSQADAVCAEYDKRLNDLGRAESVEQLAENADRALPIAQEGVGKLRELQPPENLERPVDEWLERNDRNVDLIEALRDAARAGEETRIQELAAEAAENEAAADRLAGRIGLKDCAEED